MKPRKRSRWDKVDKVARFWAMSTVAPNGCREWTGVLSTNGYGRLHFEGHRYYAHRLAWKLTHGSLPLDGLILHRCDNRRCCNVEHLYVGDQKQNLRDAYDRGRNIRGERVCFAVLTEEQVRKIKTSTCRPLDLAAEYGVNKQTIYNILRGESWKHVRVRVTEAP